MSRPDSTLLLVANWDSDVGYAWWLMESYWAVLAKRYHHHVRVLLAYPSISRLPEVIAKAPLQTMEQAFQATDLKSIWRQCRFLRRHRVRSIYFSDRATWHWRYLFYRLCGVRMIVVHDHTPGLRTAPTGIKRWLKAFVQRLPWITADGLIGATPFVCQRFIDINQAPADRCYTAANGLPELAITPTTQSVHTLFSIPDNHLILVMTGRANRYKGIDFVLECLARLRQQGCESMHFLFCGDGPDLDHFRQLTRQLNLTRQVTFTGRRDDIPALLPGCDIAIHPSLGEVGYSLSILEYMRAGLPVLVPDNPSVCGATIHERTGLIYPAGNLDGAGSALLRLIQDRELRRQMGRQAQLEVQQRYTLRATHQALLAAFEHIDRHQMLAPRSLGSDL